MSLFDIFKISKFKQRISQLENENAMLQNKLNSISFNDYETAQKIIAELNNTAEIKRNQISELEAERISLNNECDKIDKKLKTSKNKLSKTDELYKSVVYSINNYLNLDPEFEKIKLPNSDLEALEYLLPSVILKLHYMDVKSLRKAFRDNDSQIEKLLKQYQGRYTTKANQTIYDLMVIALRAELQNILYNLKYQKLDVGIEQVKIVTQKYLAAAVAGNQNIAGTLTKFIGQIEYLFINAVKIEYDYYVKKEQARQEQLALREQMRQEAEERKALDAEKKKIESEELKFNNEIEKVKQQILSAAESEKEQLNAKILELQSKLSDVILKKDSITTLQNGKAGNVYIISNLGSFGENVFKVGMTRRINPQDRVNELGDASVPFKFDVHSFIFSEDAVSLESKLHEILNNKRVNKVNTRKEFFYSSIDELEQLVNEIEPTAEFNRTMLAEEFRQSQSTNAVYASDFTLDEIDE